MTSVQSGPLGFAGLPPGVNHLKTKGRRKRRSVSVARCDDTFSVDCFSCLVCQNDLWQMATLTAFNSDSVASCDNTFNVDYFLFLVCQNDLWQMATLTGLSSDGCFWRASLCWLWPVIFRFFEYCGRLRFFPPFLQGRAEGGLVPRWRPFDWRVCCC